MKSEPNNVPVFALDETTTWDDMENAMFGAVEYQSSALGKILPLMLFAPMTEPENPDAWEPMKGLPEDLLIFSIERSADETMMKVLTRVADELGEEVPDPAHPAVRVEADGLISEVYDEMDAADVSLLAKTVEHDDDVSHFFVRGETAVLAFDRALREVTGPGTGK